MTLYKQKKINYSQISLGEDILTNASTKVVKLGVQGIPNTVLQINTLDQKNAYYATNTAIIIGYTGIFELDLRDTNAYIDQLAVVELPSGFPQDGFILIDYLTTGE